MVQLRAGNHAQTVYGILHECYPRATICLRHRNQLELLVATILSAQCTDERVNQVTPALFARYRQAADYAAADAAEMERIIRSTGFFRSKTAHIIAAAQMIQQRFAGQVPESMRELLELPGVARKTANIVLYEGFGKNEGIAVDTHVRRLSRRLGWTQQTNPVHIEKDLQELFSPAQWGQVSHYLIAHGRAVCHARGPACAECRIRRWCAYGLGGCSNLKDGV